MYLKDAEKATWELRSRDRNQRPGHSCVFPKAPSLTGHRSAGDPWHHTPSSSGMVLHPKGPLGAETSGSDEICGRSLDR